MKPQRIKEKIQHSRFAVHAPKPGYPPVFYYSLLFLFALSSCEEIGPSIDLAGENATDTTYVTTQIETPQTKNVLLEEFTGVRCVNCPEGHQLMDDFESLYGSRFIGISAHSEFLAEPYPGDQDLRTQDAQDLEEFLGPILAKPSAAIDRHLFSGESSRVHFTQKWASFVSQRMDAVTPVNIRIENDFNGRMGELKTTITLHYTAAESQDNKLSVMILEDSIIAAQLGQGNIVDSNYVHKRTLRKILTSVNGLSLTATKETGRVIVKSFRVTVPPVWKAENLRVIALVHRSDGTMEVLQVVEQGL
ncbi:MAG TPA: Omp28-related outer membrane protein [Chitinophagales bacterium]|nr:Omp28-related outer membrane protein [Chitinophagales bacterium]